MTTTIRAKVNKRLLTKASRLFTGTLAGRIIEVLQNARRAGATHVNIGNKDGYVTIRDNGGGVKDFAALLDLGGSNWSPPPRPSTPAGGADLEASEDPAGVGLFCLSPREVVIRSGGYQATIDEAGWTGRPIPVRSDGQRLPPIEPGIRQGIGTELRFPDEPWTTDAVNPLAVFTGLYVTVDGEVCDREPFLPGDASPLHGLGCRVQVVAADQITEWHRHAGIPRPYYSTSVLLNFHGQVVHFHDDPVRDHQLTFLVDMTGAPTGLRLMLPARTQLVQNEALDQLRGVLEREAYLYLQRRGSHHLPYAQWRRAQELGIELPEAMPTYRVGLLSSGSDPQPIDVVMPEGHLLAQCYRRGPNTEDQEADEANAHLLAALGRGVASFVPVHIGPEYDGYSWANLPTISKVEVRAGKELQEDWVGSGQMTAVQSLTVTAHTSDGKVYSSPVCMAVPPPVKNDGDQTSWGLAAYQVYVTEAARQLDATQIWFHLGGFADDGDTYESQEDQFGVDLDRFWAQLVGPDEPLRLKFLDCACGLKKSWRSITIVPGGGVTIRYKNGKTKVLRPPAEAVEVRP